MRTDKNYTKVTIRQIRVTRQNAHLKLKSSIKDGDMDDSDAGGLKFLT